MNINIINDTLFEDLESFLGRLQVVSPTDPTLVARIDIFRDETTVIIEDDDRECLLA